MATKVTSRQRVTLAVQHSDGESYLLEEGDSVVVPDVQNKEQLSGRVSFQEVPDDEYDNGDDGEEDQETEQPEESEGDDGEQEEEESVNLSDYTVEELDEMEYNEIRSKIAPELEGVNGQSTQEEIIEAFIEQAD